MGLSSNIVWHQTSFDGLKAIIQSKTIKYSYSLETIKWKGSCRHIAFPMISLCDIPISDMSEYLGKYGKYTIGFKREWGKRMGLSPVWYRDSNAISLREQMDSFRNVVQKDSFSLTNEEIQMWYIIANTKNYEGQLKKYNFDSYRFFDERELRLVPQYESLCSLRIKPMMSEKEYGQYKRENKGSLIENLSVNFEYDDIAYMLVSSKSHLDRVQGLFGEVKQHIVFLSYDQVTQDIIGNSHNREQ